MSVPPADSVPETASHVLDKVRNLTREIGRLTSERDRLSAQLHDSRMLEEELRDERERLRLKLRDHQFREQELVRKEESLERQLAMFKQRVVQLSEEKESLENRLNTSMGTTDSLHAGRESLVARLSGVETELSTLRLDKESAKRKLAESESELGILREENSAMSARMVELESASAKREEDGGKLEGAFHETHEKLNAVTAERDALSKELEETRGVRDQLQEELDRLVFRSRREYLRFGMISLTVVAIACFVFWASSALFNRGALLDLQEAERKVDTLENDIRNYLTKLSQKNKEIVFQEREIVGLKETIAELQAELKEMQETLTSVMKEKDAKINALLSRVSLLEKQKTEDMEQAKVETATQVASLNQRINLLKREIDELRKTKAKVIPPLIEALSHPDVSVRVGASKALSDLTNKLFGPDQKKWRDWWLRNRLDFDK